MGCAGGRLLRCGPHNPGSSHRAPLCCPATQELTSPQNTKLTFFWDHQISSLTTAVLFTQDRGFHSVDQIITAETRVKMHNLPQNKGLFIKLFCILQVPPQ